ncbi:MAG: ATP synthase F1 subunit gamma [Cyclobacteriaceae bacterium]|nr:ATP synthase F1 subunit gamma [Cyclobacteriaceae bacterium]
MANLKEVKSRIKSVQSTQQITKAMKMVAASKLRRAQDVILQMRPYADKLESILTRVTSILNDDIENVYAIEREIRQVLLIVITSDKGLCGGFNSNLLKNTLNHIQENYADQFAAGNLVIMPIGRKGNEYFRKRGFLTISEFHNLQQNLTFADAKRAAQLAMDAFTDKAFDRVDILYNEFKNVATQIVRKEQFLPIPEFNAETDDLDETSVSKQQSASAATSYDYIFEPSVEYLLEEIIPQSLRIVFYKALLESNASEQGARMTAMDKATENAGELLKELNLMYNRTRQAAITKEILEIVGGADALAK